MYVCVRVCDYVNVAVESNTNAEENGKYGTLIAFT